MKTAMQKMLDYLEKECQQTITNQWHINKVKELLADEEVQIITAFDDGDIHSDSTAIDGKEYYLEKYMI